MNSHLKQLKVVIICDQSALNAIITSNSTYNITITYHKKRYKKSNLGPCEHVVDGDLLAKQPFLVSVEVLVSVALNVTL